MSQRDNPYQQLRDAPSTVRVHPELLFIESSVRLVPLRMKPSELTAALKAASEAAHAAGDLMRRNLRRTKKVNESTHHDLKLDLDIRCQRLITRRLASAFPAVPVLGEEGIDEKSLQAVTRWVVDPIDGTVNFAYGIPHACVSIALQTRIASAPGDASFRTDVGVVYDPFLDEEFTAIRGKPARLNSRPIQASRRTRLDEAIISVGFAKSEETLNSMLPAVGRLAHRVRKLRLMGSAALALVYVADGRFDAYIEPGVRLWDIAAGGLIVECAGGEFWCEPLPGDHVYRLNANNGRLRKQIERAIRE